MGLVELILTNLSQVVVDTITESLSKGLFRRGGCVYYPVIVCFFLFIVFLNILGLFSYVFTPTAHLAVTLGISYSIVMGITVSG